MSAKLLKPDLAYRTGAACYKRDEFTAPDLQTTVAREDSSTLQQQMHVLMVL